MGQPYVKQYVEERELTVMLMVDASWLRRLLPLWAGSSVNWPAELAAVLSFSATTKGIRWD